MALLTIILTLLFMDTLNYFIINFKIRVRRLPRGSVYGYHNSGKTANFGEGGYKLGSLDFRKSDSLRSMIN